MAEEADLRWMRVALRLARYGIGTTHPNPRVGAVVVREGKLVGQGWHRRPGEPHAEVLALADAGARAQGATLYVTLEPCAAFGRTPPCTEAIRAAAIRRVVYGSRDPNPAMAGGGAVLAEAGLAVVGGVLRGACDELNRPFFHAICNQRPWVIAKAAISLDGRMATETGDSRWISGVRSRRHAHRLRAGSDAILVGAGTLRADNPRLTPRGVRRRGAQPLRVVVARTLPRFREDYHLCDGAAPSRIYCAEASASERATWEASGVEVVVCAGLPAVLSHLHRDGRLQVLVEGGGMLHGALLRARLVDELVLYQAPILIGGDGAPALWGGKGIEQVACAPRLREVQRRQLDGDLVIRGLIDYGVS